MGPLPPDRSRRRGGAEMDPSGKGYCFPVAVVVGAGAGLEKASGSHQGRGEEARKKKKKKKGRRAGAKQPLGKC